MPKAFAAAAPSSVLMVNDADATRLQAVLDSSAVRIADRRELYRESGWTSLIPTPPPTMRTK